MSAAWQTVTLSEVCEFKPAKKQAKQKLDEGDLISFAPMGDLGELRMQFAASEDRPLAKVYSGYTYFADGDVLCAKITPCFENGKMGVAAGLTNGIGFGSSEFVVMRPSARILAEYLFYFMLRDEFRVSGAKVMMGAVGHKRVPKEYFEDHTIPLPPLDEQKRIVAVLDQAFAALDRARANAEANLADAEELFEVGLDSLISKHGNDADHTNLGAICTFENGDRGKNYPGRKAFVPAGIPFINAGHLEDGAIDWDAMNYIPEEHFHRLAKGKVRPDDLLFCLRGSLGKFGKVDREGLGAIASSLVIVRAMGDVLTDFLSIYFRSKTCKLMIEDYAGGAAQPNLSAGDLRKFKIALPSLAAQRQAIDEYDALANARSRLVSAYREHLSDLEDLRQSILQKAFAGELT